MRGVRVGVAALGCALAWWRSERVEAPVLARPAVVRFTATVDDTRQTHGVPTGSVRFTITAPDGTTTSTVLPSAAGAW